MKMLNHPRYTPSHIDDLTDLLGPIPITISGLFAAIAGLIFQVVADFSFWGQPTVLIAPIWSYFLLGSCFHFSYVFALKMSWNSGDDPDLNYGEVVIVMFVLAGLTAWTFWNKGFLIGMLVLFLPIWLVLATLVLIATVVFGGILILSCLEWVGFWRWACVRKVS